MDDVEGLEGIGMIDIPDFLELPLLSPTGDVTALLRSDLADLRLHVCHPGGLDISQCLSSASRDRLVANGLLKYRRVAVGALATPACLCFPTALGIETTRANASCIDGSEGLPRTPHQRRQDYGRANARQRLADRAPVLRVLKSTDPAYAAILTSALDDIIPPARFRPSPLTEIRTAHDRRMQFRAAVMQWLRRRWCYANLLWMSVSNDKKFGCSR